MVLSISTQAGFDFGIATNGNDIIDFAQLPSSEIAQLQGSPSTDAIVLLGGNDIAVDDAAGRIYFGNAGDDVINGGGGADTLAGGQNNDRLEGGTENDLLFGNLGSDNLLGGDGDDTILGGQDNDILLGEGGNDVLGGERGFDTLTGGTGSDQFILASSGVQGTDVVTDFQDGVDRILLPEGTSLASTEFQSSGTSTLIVRDGDTLMVLNNVTPSQLDIFDFVRSGGSSTPPQNREPGNSPGDALNLGVLTGKQVFNDFVGGSDTDDFYRFNVTSPMDFYIFLDGLSADVDLRLYQDKNQNNQIDSSDFLDSSNSSRTRSEFIDRQLNIGTYFLRVYPDSEGDNTSYNLQLVNETSETINIGELSGTLPFSGFLSSSNLQDTYQFQIGSPKTVNISLSELSDDADLILYEDSNRNGLPDSRVSSSNSSGTRSDSIERNLPIGNYFLKVYTQNRGDSTNYSLSLSA
ncbi:Alkaline phosphatase [Geitlerinema sp. FC II]|nr:Alkaline phosphatase [Geitlerinema sp. FC II]